MTRAGRRVRSEGHGCDGGCDVLSGAPGWVHVREAACRGAGTVAVSWSLGQPGWLGRRRGTQGHSGEWLAWRGRRESMVGRAVGNVLQPLGVVDLLPVPLPLALRERSIRGRLRGAPRRGALAVVRVQGGRRLGAGALGVQGLRGAPRRGALAVVRVQGGRRLGAGALGVRGLRTRKTGPVALYGRPRPPGGPSASALDGSAREMAMEVACREAKERGIGAMRGREARLAGLVLAGLVKKSVVTVVATVVASAVGMWASCAVMSVTSSACVI